MKEEINENGLQQTGRSPSLYVPVAHDASHDSPSEFNTPVPEQARANEPVPSSTLLSDEQRSAIREKL